MADKINSIDEILEFAIAREIEAYQLYIYLSQWVDNPEISRICEDFATEELEHKEKLELEIMKRGEVVPNFDIQMKTSVLEKAVSMDYKELLAFAMEKEQTSIDLYTQLANITADKESQETLLAIIEEENHHKKRFEEEYNTVYRKK